MEQADNILVILSTLQFAWSYWRNCYRKGYKFDFWHLTLLELLLVLQWMRPAAASKLNALTIGPILAHRSQPFVAEATLISAIGYFCVVAGGSLWKLKLGIGLRKKYSQALNSWVRLSLMNLQSRRLLLAQFGLTVVLILVPLAIYWSRAGFRLNLGGLAIEDSSIRPLVQLSGFLAVLVGSFALERYISLRDKAMLALPIILTLLLLFYGSRSFFLSIGLTAVTVWLVHLRHRLRLSLLFAGVAVFMLVTSVLNGLRGGHLDLGSALALYFFNALYGNSFSDLRDFAIILGSWNGQYFLGKTYLAGLLAFVPRVLSSFRGTWSIGVVTATLVGFSPATHPGLRVGAFGEAFLNFGIPGVVVIGLALGSMTRLLDMRIKETLATNPRPPLLTYAYFSIATLTALVSSSVAASLFYSMLLFFGFSWLAVRVSRFIGFPLA